LCLAKVIIIKIVSWEHFNVNFNVRFNNFLEQSSCAFSWINRRRDNIKMHGKTAKRKSHSVLLRMSSVSKKKFAEKISAHILCSGTFLRRSCRLRDNVHKHGRAIKATVYNVIRRRKEHFASRISKVRIQSHIHNI